jgi:hypothetical protein
LGRRRVAKDALSLRRCQPGSVPWERCRAMWQKNPKNIYSDFTRDNTLGGKLLATDLTLE